MQTSVAMTAFTSLNKFMRREVWHLADGPELNNVQQTSRASTLILITEQTTWLQSDALMKTFTSFPGFIPPPPPPKSSDLRERNICIVFVSKEHERFAESVNLSIDYYRLNPPRNSLYSIRCLRWEILQKNENSRKSRLDDRGCSTTQTRLIQPYFTLSPRDPFSIKRKWNRLKRWQRASSSCYYRGGAKLLSQRDWATWSGREF